MKTLKICLFRELPDILNRDSEYLYLTYDKLLLFMGQTPYYDPYVICESVPENPIEGYIYILFNGTVKALVGDNVVDIAEIEEVGQLENLRKLGTTFFIKADRRYLDLQRRTLQLPYHNGTYSMTVDMAKDLRITNQTVVRYDQATESFYIEGEHLPTPRFTGYKGKESKTVSVEVNDHCIHADVRVSSAPGNLIRKLNGGLYANVDDKVSREQFNRLKSSYEELETQSHSLLESVNDLMKAEHSEVISEDSILAMVVNAVSEYDRSITELVSNYNTVYEKLQEIETESRDYTDKVFKEKSNAIAALINSSVIQNVWGEI